jgi:hypothetical protein
MQPVCKDRPQLEGQAAHGLLKFMPRPLEGGLEGVLE